jgi:hypothetical protein
MDSNGTSGNAVFATAEELESYCSRVASRLRKRWQERSDFLASAVDRLQSLRNAASLVQDTELEQELSDRLSAAREEIKQLESLARDQHLELV